MRFKGRKNFLWTRSGESRETDSNANSNSYGFVMVFVDLCSLVCKPAWLSLCANNSMNLSAGPVVHKHKIENIIEFRILSYKYF